MDPRSVFLSFFNESVYKATELTKGKRNKLFKDLELNSLIESSVLKRTNSLENAEKLWEIATDNFEKNGINVFFAENGNKVKEFIYSKIKNTKLVIKGKSLTTEEIRLRQFLESKNIETLETDLGEWIIQLNNELPSHFTAPAVHLSKEEVAEIVNREIGTELNADPEEITQFVRKLLREKFETAEVGIIGANFVIANPSTIISVSNEGNVSLCARLPKQVFVVVGYDRIYDDYKGIENLQCLLTSSATGQIYTSYIDFIKKPLPHQKITLIVLDNGRKELISSEFSESSRCIRCASCLNTCPVYSEVGGHVFGEVYHGGIGSLLTHFTGSKNTAEQIAGYCSRCSTCEEYCPMEIPISSLVSKLAKNYKLPFYLKIPLKLMGEVKAITKKESKSALFIGCAFRTPLLKSERKEICQIAKKLFSKDGELEIIDSGCCGMPHFYKGELEESLKRKKKLIKVLSQFENVYIPCSSGYSFLKESLSDKLKLLSTEIVEKIPEKLEDENIHYHLPCHFKNAEGRKEFDVLSKKIDFKEWEQEKCCGSAGTYFVTHPFISKKILKRKQMIQENAYKIITSCPSCIIQLRRIFKKENVVHSATYLSKNLK